MQEYESLNQGHSGWEPPNWREVLANIREMRIARDAPVDSMGAEKCMDDGCTPEVKKEVLNYIYLYVCLNIPSTFID